jgi:hypothetical protein
MGLKQLCTRRTSSEFEKNSPIGVHDPPPRMLWGDGAKFDDKLVWLVEPPGLLDEKKLRDAVDAVAAGAKEIPEVLLVALAKAFGCYPVAQSGSEVDVKLVKWIFNMRYERIENVITRFRLFAAKHDWISQIATSFKDGGIEVLTARKEAREQHVVEKKGQASRVANDANVLSGVDTVSIAAAAVVASTWRKP